MHASRLSIEVEETIRTMSKRKAVDIDELPAELLKLIFNEDRYGNHCKLEHFHAIVIAIWRGGGLPHE